jgi:hypothetical protein
MEPKDRRRRDSSSRTLTTSANAIDAAYGLEPVFEPGTATGAASESPLADFVTVGCPYCGERFGMAVDLTAGSHVQIEDCQICCQPIEFRIRVGRTGNLKKLSTNRLD